ncbi:Ethanolamine-phosphate cytidylyltransferase [Diplonema papillatum]|nr:Ethanolamine-phosphate cytidylyltransferase [Diplonema papillatum]
MLANIPRATDSDERFPGVKELLDKPGEINKPYPKAKGIIRIWVDGCFDMLHFGHANALRQAALLGHELYVGIHTDEEVVRFKGPPIMHDHERYAAARACKWVSRVIEGVPYVTELSDIEKYEIDFVVHGDDMSTDLNGNNSYQAIIDAGRFKIVKRTDGISTTDLVGRMLLLTKCHHHGDDHGEDDPKTVAAKHADTTYSRYLTTSRKIVQFSNNRAPGPDDKVVYVGGRFDCFHCGHMAMLEEARKKGTYLIVGLYSDSVINKLAGANYPIMNVNERVLGVLSCRYVDEVIMGVPYDVTKDLIEQLKIDVVVQGTTGDAKEEGSGIEKDPYVVPKEMGIYGEVTSSSTLTTGKLIERVIQNRLQFEERQKKKIPKDDATKKAGENSDIREI